MVAVVAAPAAVVASLRGGGATVDRTVSCTTQVMGGVHGFWLNAFPKSPVFHYSVVDLGTGGATQLVWLDTRFKGFNLTGSSCRNVRVNVPLARAGLPLEGTYAAGDYGGFNGRCLLPGRVLVRVRLHLDSSGKPQSALLAVRMARKHRPVAFVQWSPKHVTAYISRTCTS